MRECLRKVYINHGMALCTAACTTYKTFTSGIPLYTFYEIIICWNKKLLPEFLRTNVQNMT